MTAATFKSRIDGAEVISLWGRPDMSVLSANRRKPPAMPSGLFGDLWPLATDLAEGAGSPVDYVGLSLIVTAASLIGGKRKVRPYSTSAWAEPCIQWGACVGDPSYNKSPGIDCVTDPLRAIERDAAGDHSAKINEWQADTERAKAEKAQWADAVKAATKDGLDTPRLPPAAIVPDAPERRRPLVMDTTPEVLGTILAGNPSGTLHLRDELAGWLESFDRYSPGGRTFWLEAYGGRPFVIDRQKQDRVPLRIPFNGVSVLGGVQPERLADALLGGVDDGLVARFLWAWPDKVPFARPRSIADVGRLERIYRALEAMAWGISPEGEQVAVTIPLEPRAADFFDKWAEVHDNGSDDAGALFKGMVGKMRGTVLRLALVGEILRWADQGGPEPTSISTHMVGCAVEYVEDYQKPMAMRVFGDAALPLADRNAAILARYIVKHKLAKINARDVRRSSGLPGLKDAGRLKDAIDALVEADWLRPMPTRDGDLPGRAKSDFLVNPALAEAA